MSLNTQYNMGPRIKVALGTTSLSLSQSSATALSTQDGLTIDRTLLGRRYYSCKAVAALQYQPGSSQRSLTLAINVQHSSDGTSWDTLTTGVAATFGSTNGSTFYGTAETSANLNGARRYIRVALLAPTFADCSSGQGVLSGNAVVVFGGADELPAI